ncbi:MAG: MAPEG family protein [Glycocaulis sp.]|uniref:MAPEG family protein n=1 Tax=Glycocaulis sp. TaxID=1969725 RepID=UPI003F719ABE
MTIDASLLVIAVLIYAAMIVVQVIFSNLEHSPKDQLGARDGLTDSSLLTSRAKRANQNMVEAMLLHAPLALVAISTGSANDLTALGGWLFVAGRTIYAPLYWFGVPVLRTLAWFLAVAGTAIILFQVLPFSGAA